jgi:hypothetical protein
MLKSDKVISSFSLGIEGESVLIRGEPDSGGRIPITVILPANTDLGRLEPAVTFIGKSLSPPSGEPRDFNSPVLYRVTAEDDSFQDYVVLVHVKNRFSNRIVWFDLEVPRLGAHILAEGVVTENPAAGGTSEIVVHIPSGTDRESLAAHIVHTGASLLAPDGQVYTETVVSLTGDFSLPSVYRVTAEDGGIKDYLVTVLVDQDSSKEIQAFSFDGLESRETVLVGSAPQPDGKIHIVVTVPVDTDLAALKPVITHTGVSISGAGISAGGPGTVSAAEAVDFSPAGTAAHIYTVQAEDGSTREYQVTVYCFDRDSGKQITGFYFIFPNSPAEGAAGIINETAKTIAVTVPSGTDLRSLSPVVYHTGASVSPISGAPEDFSGSPASPVPYTVKARDGSEQTYQVSVFTAKDSSGAITDFDLGIPNAVVSIGSVPGADGKFPIIITVSDPTKPIDLSALTPEISHTGVSVTGDGIPAGGSGTVTADGPVDFTSPVNYTVTAEDGTQQDYTITVIDAGDASSSDPSSGLAKINGFYFATPLAAGQINENAKTISVTVPYGTDRSSLIPTIYYSGGSIAQGTGVQNTEHPAVIGGDFSGPVVYTVTSRNSANIASYTVNVGLGEKPLSGAKEITALGFAGIPAAGTTAVIAALPDADGFTPIEVTVPPGTDWTSLAPVITHTGDSITGPAGTPSGPGTVNGAPADFSSPVSYTVRAEDGTTRGYRVTLHREDNNAKIITGFYFAEPLAVGAINQDAKTITVTVPYGTDLGALKPTVYYTGASLNPVSGRENDFSFPVTYTVTARNNTVQPYTVRVSARQSGAKEITGFSFPGVGILETVIGSIPGPNGSIPIAITVADRTDISALKPNISHTGKSISPASGDVQNFSGPVSYRVTAEDGSVKDYAVSVHISNNSSKIISGFAFKSVPAGNASVQAVGQVDQEAHTILVVLPRSAAASIADLAPTITYIGSSIGIAGGAPQSVHPFTDAPRNFNGTENEPLVYQVTAGDGSVQDYGVTVVVEEQNLGLAVTFLGISDPDLISESFDQSTGTLSLQLNPVPGYTAPYEWYLDGQKCAVSSTEPGLTLKTGDLARGQHEVVAVATGSDAKHYSSKIYFLVHE